MFIGPCNIFVGIATLKYNFFSKNLIFSLIAAGKIKHCSKEGHGKVREFQSWSCVATMDIISVQLDLQCTHRIPAVRAVDSLEAQAHVAVSSQVETPASSAQPGMFVYDFPTPLCLSVC